MGLRSGEWAFHGFSVIREITLSASFCAKSLNVAFAVWGVAPSCINHFQMIAFPQRRRTRHIKLKDDCAVILLVHRNGPSISIPKLVRSHCGFRIYRTPSCNLWGVQRPLQNFLNWYNHQDWNGAHHWTKHYLPCPRLPLSCH